MVRPNCRKSGSSAKLLEVAHFTVEAANQRSRMRLMGIERKRRASQVARNRKPLRFDLSAAKTWAMP